MAATVPVFDGTNYKFWNVKMRTLFLSMDLWDTVENGYDDESDRERQKRDAAALSQIQQGVSDWIFPRIMEATKAKEAWDILQTEFQRDRKPTLISSFSKSKETDLIVATLIATVTFAAGITMPGGYINDNKDPNQGMAILTRKAAFIAFVITDNIALTLSLFSVMYHLWIMTDDPILIKQQLALAFLCTAYAIIAMLVAFITGTYAVLASSSLSIFVWAIPSVLFFVCPLYGWTFLSLRKSEDIRRLSLSLPSEQTL